MLNHLKKIFAIIETVFYQFDEMRNGGRSLLQKQLNDEIDDASVDTLAKSVTLHFGPHISADTRQMVGHLLGSLQDIRPEISDTVVLKNLDIETLWNQYEQFIKETDALYVV